MTTKNSPIEKLRAQADKIAATLKNACTQPQPKETCKAGVVMDDKILTIEMTWKTIRETSHAALAEYVLNQMTEAAPQ